MTFPCDLALLATSADGSAFIKTSSLDGEKNLKKREQVKGFENLVPNVHSKAVEAICKLKGYTFAANPNKDLHKFDTYMMIEGQEQLNMNEDQLLLKGAQLANTEWVLGQVVYTGKQTKIMMNLQSGVIKMSHLER